MVSKPAFTEHRVPQEQGKPYARDYDGTGPAFVLMHGFPDNLRIYGDLIPYLTAAGRRVVAFDFLGFGASDKTAGATYSFEQQLAQKGGFVQRVRNRLAHCVMHPNRAPGGSTEWRLKEPAEWQRREGFTITQMRVIARNFSELSSILRMSFLGEQRQESSAPFARALLELPNEADCADPSEKQKLAISKLPPN